MYPPCTDKAFWNFIMITYTQLSHFVFPTSRKNLNVAVLIWLTWMLRAAGECEHWAVWCYYFDISIHIDFVITIVQVTFLYPQTVPLYQLVMDRWASTKSNGKVWAKLASESVCPPHIPHGSPRYWIRTSKVNRRRRVSLGLICPKWWYWKEVTNRYGEEPFLKDK